MGSEFFISRRRLLKVGTVAAIASPFVWSRSAFAAGQVIIRSPGGAPEENNRKVVWDPFEKETGIRVVPVPSTAAKLFAMHKAGAAELDVIDINAGPLINLHRLGALAPIDYSNWEKTNPDDIPASQRTSHRVGYNMFATVLGYNAAAFGEKKAPNNWSEFWDTKAFPGPRSLGDLATGNPNLEAALLADGVARDKIYPMDLDRAFASLSRIRDSIPKFWDTGALCAQMLIDKEVHMSSIWTSRINPAIGAGQPLKFTWNDHLTITQSLGIFKTAKNMENAQRLIEFTLRPEIQAASVQAALSAPTNQKAYQFLPPNYGELVPGSPQHANIAIALNEEWWEDNREVVSRRWARWIQG